MLPGTLTTKIQPSREAQSRKQVWDAEVWQAIIRHEPYLLLAARSCSAQKRCYAHNLHKKYDTHAILAKGIPFPIYFSLTIIDQLYSAYIPLSSIQHKGVDWAEEH